MDSAPSGEIPSDPRVGQVLQGRYQILAPIAQGGMGSVYRGERVGLGRQVAIKFLHSSMARDPAIMRRFELEARAMSRLSHPNCIGVLDFGMDDLPYLVMDLVQGDPLASAIENGPLAPTRALRIVRQILAGLSHAHAQGIVHRDIKPENIVLERSSGLRDHARILDFGLAKLLGTDHGLTAGMAIGTPNYMAPEQMQEGAIDARADLYATGIVLYEMLTGRKPFDAAEIGEVFVHQLSTPPPLLRASAPGRFSQALEAVVLKAMAKSPSARFASADAMIEALEVVPEATGTPGPIAGAAGITSGVESDATLMHPGTPLPGHSPGADEPPAPAARPAAKKPTPETARAGLSGTEATEAIVSPSAAARRSAPARARRALAPRIALAAGGACALIAIVAVIRSHHDRAAARSAMASAASATPGAPEAGDPPAAQAHAVAPASAAHAPARAKPETREPTAQRPRAAGAGRSAGLPRRTAMADGQRELQHLRELRRSQPRNPTYPAEIARLSFEQHRWDEGLEAFRAAIRLDPKRRSDPTLVNPVITSLESDRKGERAAFLRELGAPARPLLREAAEHHPNARVRARAAELLEPPGPHKKPFLRWL